jgi:2-polyprenyl-6-methoxyphenol hydroxylase-like FAD-dependent oxidoreductase
VVDIPVLIIGAGPVGLTMAVDLARRGVGVRIVDRLPAPTTESRAIIVHARSLDQLEALGVYDELMATGITATGAELHADGKALGRVAFDTIEAVHRFSLVTAQTETERVLLERLEGLGVRIDRPLTFSGFSQDADAVSAQLTDADGAATTVRAAYLVGADGAKSTVRHAMGQHLQGDFKGEDYLLGDVDADYDVDRTAFHIYFGSGDAGGVLFPMIGDRARVFAQLPDGTDPDKPATREWLQEALDERRMGVRITATHWLTRFMIKHAQAPAYRSGRVFIAGDAAHIHSPAGGLGMNTGIQDAVNLGWKLATAVTAAGGAVGAQRLLDSYQAERHPVAAAVIKFTTELTHVGTVGSAPIQHFRNRLVNLALHLPPAGRHFAGTVEQQTIEYRHSAVVSGGSGSVRAGDFLYVPGMNIAAALATVEGNRHLAIVVPAADGMVPAVSSDQVSMAPAPVSEAMEQLRHATGLGSGGLVVVRPDGYIGLVASAEGAQQTLDGYVAGLTA